MIRGWVIELAFLVHDDAHDAVGAQHALEQEVFDLPTIGAGAPDPIPQRRFRQVEAASRRAARPAFIEDQSHGSRLELVGEAPTGPLRLPVRQGRPRIHLSEGVHQIGSGPAVVKVGPAVTPDG